MKLLTLRDVNLFPQDQTTIMGWNCDLNLQFESHFIAPDPPQSPWGYKQYSCDRGVEI